MHSCLTRIFGKENVAKFPVFLVLARNFIKKRVFWIYFLNAMSILSLHSFWIWWIYNVHPYVEIKNHKWIAYYNCNSFDCGLMKVQKVYNIAWARINLHFKSVYIYCNVFSCCMTKPSVPYPRPCHIPSPDSIAV